MSKCAQGRDCSRDRMSSKYDVPGSGVRIVNPAWNSWWRSTNAHRFSKSASRHAGIDHEVAGDAIPQRARNLHALSGLIDRRVLLQAGEPFVGRRLEAEKDVEVLRDRAPRLEQLRVARDQIDAALHENPPLPDAAAAQLLRQREAARRVVPEQIVGDEDVVPGRGEVPAHRFDRTLPHRARVQLPDRTERAAERTSARGLDQPRGPMGETRVLTPPRRDEMARRQRNLVELEGRRIRGRCDRPRQTAPAPSGPERPATAGRRRSRPRSAAPPSRHRRESRHRRDRAGKDAGRPPRCGRR